MLPITVNELRFKSGTVATRKLKGTVTNLVPLRPREYADGCVLNFTLVDASATATAASAAKSVRVFLFDAWARGLSFVAEGDEVELSSSFELVPCPDSINGASAAGSAARASIVGAENLVVPNAETVAVVWQPAEHGDMMELEVNAQRLDDPIVRVRRAKPSSTAEGLLLAQEA